MNTRNTIRIIVVTIAILAAGAATIFIFKSMQKEDSGLKIAEFVAYAKVDEVRYDTIASVISGTATVSSENKIAVFSEVPGKLIETGKDFKKGVYYPKGSTLIKIDDRETRLNYFSQKSDFLNLLATAAPDLKLDFPEVYGKWKAYLDNFDIREPVPEIPPTETSKEKYFLASRNIFKVYYALKTAEERLDKYEIKAPFDGTVTASFVDLGSRVSPGQKLGDFAGIGVYEAEFPVTAYDLKFIKIGMNAELTSRELGEAWSGKVVRISEIIDRSTQTAAVFVRSNERGLRDGLFVDVRISGAEMPGVFKIPRNALRNNRFANVVLEDSTLKRVEVETVRTDEKFAYIRGLDPGTRVAVEPLAESPEGTKVVPIRR